MTSGTVVGNTTVQASPATMKTQNGTIAVWENLEVQQGYDWARTGWDLNHGGITPKKPLSAFCMCYYRDSYNAGDSGLTYGGEWDGIRFAIDSEYQSRYDACSSIHVKMDNVCIRRDHSNDFTTGCMQFDIIKSEVEVLEPTTILGQTFPPDRYSTSNLYAENVTNCSWYAYNGWDCDSYNSFTEILYMTVQDNYSIQVTVTFV